jgi:spore maturation protein CgeB
MSHRYDGIEKDWDLDMDLVDFSDTKDLIEKCQYFLKQSNNKMRKTIANTGCNKVHSNFSYRSMVQNLINIHNGKA